jgi:hypothetical protein
MDQSAVDQAAVLLERDDEVRRNTGCIGLASNVSSDSPLVLVVDEGAAGPLAWARSAARSSPGRPIRTRLVYGGP